MASRVPFGAAELAALGQGLRIARETTGHYFGLTDDWFERTSHQVCTLKDLRRDEILGEGRLAQIRRLQRIREETPDAVLRCEHLCPHYRICLQDHNILVRLSTDASVGPRDFLSYVLIHEYVHLIRFDRLEHPYRIAAEGQALEEARVDQITRAIASRLGPETLRRAVTGSRL